MTFHHHLVRVTGRVVFGSSLALATLWLADASPALGSRGGGDPQEQPQGAGVQATTSTTRPATTTTTFATQTVTTADPGTGTAGDGQGAAPGVSAAGDGQGTDPVQAAGGPTGASSDPAPAESLAAQTTAADPAPARITQPRTALPRTGAGSIADELALGLSLMGAGLAATTASRRRRRTT